MKFIIKTYAAYLPVLVIYFSITSCKKLIEIPPNPSDKITAEQAFSDSLNLLSVMTGIYNNFNIVDDGSALNFHNGGLTFYTGLSADELITRDINYQQYQIPFYNNSLLPNSAYVPYMWETAYKSIYNINAALEGIAGSTGLSSTLSKRLNGELKTVRALYYFNLVNLFGGVPLVTTTDFRVNGSLPRSTPDKVYEQIVDDLEEASTLMVADYPSEGRARPNVYTAKALLAKVYLYTKNWQKAADLSGEVIDDAGLYSLESDLNNVFLHGSTEAIWQFSSEGANFSQTDEGTYFVPYPEEIPSVVVTPELLNDFETDDQRKTSWIGEAVVDDESYFFPYKYKNKSTDDATTIEDYMILRLGEQYLIRSEARAHLDQPSDALEDLNMVRERAGLNALSFTDDETLMADIMHERRIELFCEWGNRWYDLKRTDLANTVLGTKPNWQTTDILYPVPLIEMQTNPFLVQNPGY